MNSIKKAPPEQDKRSALQTLQLGWRAGHQGCVSVCAVYRVFVQEGKQKLVAGLSSPTARGKWRAGLICEELGYDQHHHRQGPFGYW
jgi:hypothetical protein